MIRAERTDARGNVAEIVEITAQRIHGDRLMADDEVLLKIAGAKVTKTYSIPVRDLAALAGDVFPDAFFAIGIHPEES